jgi:hypothetical protein
MKNLIILASVLMFGACASVDGANDAHDSYFFEVKEYEKTELNVVMDISPSVEIFKKKRNKFIPGSDDDIKSFAVLSPSINKCTIYTIDPVVLYEPEYLGHELAHCIWGRFHGEQNHKPKAIINGGL